MFDIGRQCSICCQMAPIGVEPSRAWVVVACREMRITFQLPSFTSCDQHHLGVRLQPYHAVQDLRTDRLKGLSPIDVGLFIKASLEFNHYSDFLASADRLAQQVHQLRVAARAVNGLLDSQDLRVMDRFAQEVEHTAKTLKWLVNQDIALLESVKK